jgi:hypothetical protein
MRANVLRFGLVPLTVILAVAATQQHEQPAANGTIYGVAIDTDGKPAKGLSLTASSLDVGGSGGLPRTKTNDAGEYRFDKLPWWGRYRVYADDEEAGYSRISTGPLGDSHPAEVEITPEHPKTGFNLALPPKAGFIQIHLTNRITGKAIPGMIVWVVPMEKPDSGLFTTSCYSDHPVLVPPDKNFLLHVKSDGFREWDESVGTGKPVNVPSGSRLRLDVQLDPSS